MVFNDELSTIDASVDQKSEEYTIQTGRSVDCDSLTPLSPASTKNGSFSPIDGMQSALPRTRQNTIKDPPSLDYIYNITSDTAMKEFVEKKAAHSTEDTNTSKQAPRLIRINNKKQNKKVKVRKTVTVKIGGDEKFIPLPERHIEAHLFKTSLFPSNKITTTQYWWWNYIPVNFLLLNLYYQYRYQLHNWYFLIVMVFTLIPGVSPVSPITSVLPVVFILGVNMLKDLVEDFKRFRKNRKENNRVVTVIRNGQKVPIRTGQLTVGEIVYLTSEDAVPADLLILYASNPGNKCYVETSQLDGEANMKPRFGKSQTAYLNNDEILSQFTGDIRLNAPVKDLEKVEGTISFENANGEHIEEAIGPENMVLKGCTLKNTATFYGVVCYTGMESKLMLNTSKRKKKTSFIDTRVNLILVFLLLIHQAMCIVFTVLYCISYIQNAPNTYYIYPEGLQGNDINFKFVVFGYFTQFILLNLLIPMSLFVSLQFIKEIQAYFMRQDLNMYYEEGDIPMDVGAADLNADLSQIDIVFSDKTGTLTNNTMVFKRLSIGPKVEHNEELNEGHIGKMLISGGTFVAGDPKMDNIHRQLAMHYMLNLAINNEIIIENGVYSGESPDEISLVSTAAANGFKLELQTDTETVLTINGITHRFQKIYTIKFTPDRKKMSVIVRIPMSLIQQFPWFTPGGFDIRNPLYSEKDLPCVCYTKGADSFMIPLLSKTSEYGLDVEYLLQETQKYLDNFATEGLRTLLLTHRVVIAEDAIKWRARYIKASAVTSDSRVRSLRMDRVASEIEEEMELCGTTAIEDRLQEGVPETIDFLLQAGIQFWVLTGDKRQTAKNVAQLARIIKAYGPKESLTFVEDIELEYDPDPLVEQKRAFELLNRSLINIMKIKAENLNPDICLVMNGSVVSVIERDLEIAKLFAEVCVHCKTVIVCRAIPAHKQGIVRQVYKMFRKNGLAIGDGANDVSMIQQAKVGVGISGKEGSQAVNAADYALPRFYHLKRLLAVHGRYSLTRSALFVQYSFYKNLVLTFLEFFFGFYCQWSGQTIIDSYVLTLYNLVFTLLPPFVMGIFEKDVDEYTLEKWPDLYKNLKLDKFGFGQSLTLPSFLAWCGSALYHSIVVFFITLYACYPETLETAKSDGIWDISTVLSINVFLVVNAKAILEMNYFTVLNHLSIWLSILLFFAFLFAYASIKIFFGSSAMYWIPFELFSHGRFYLIVFLVLVLALIPDVCLKAAKKSFFASEWEKRKKERLKEKARLRKQRRLEKKRLKKLRKNAHKLVSETDHVSEVDIDSEELKDVSL
jgi:phospholipid-transporting ATPase